MLIREARLEEHRMMSLRKGRRWKTLPPSSVLLPVESVMFNLRRVLSRRDVATATNVPRCCVRNWESAMSVRAHVLRRLRGLLGVLYELNVHTTFYGVRQWMRMRNRYLNGRRALDVYAERGGAKKIRKAIEEWVRSMDQNSA